MHHPALSPVSRKWKGKALTNTRAWGCLLPGKLQFSRGRGSRGQEQGPAQSWAAQSTEKELVGIVSLWHGGGLEALYSFSCMFCTTKTEWKFPQLSNILQLIINHTGHFVRTFCSQALHASFENFLATRIICFSMAKVLPWLRWGESLNWCH